MKKLIFLTIATFLLSERMASAETPVERYGQLKVQGNRIVDKNGDAVQLRGMSLFWSQWIGKYYTRNTIAWLKNDWCISVVRAAMGADSSDGGYAKSAAIANAEKNKVIAVVDAAIAEGIYVIIDFHSHNAHYPINRAAAKAFFAEMSAKYKDVPNVIYEPWNEPTNVSWASVIKPYHEEIIEIIRANDPDNIIVCGTRQWCQRVDEAANDPIIISSNIAYTLHFYAYTHRAQYRTFASTALSKNAALFVTEYGTCHSSGNTYLDSTETKIWWKFMDDNKLSYCNWSVADKVETASILTPGASANGNWTDAQITESGKLVRNNLRANCSFTSSLESDNLLRNKIQSFPNPFAREVTISLTGAFSYVITDLLGHVVASGRADNVAVLGESFRSGLYMVKIDQGESTAFLKITKE